MCFELVGKVHTKHWCCGAIGVRHHSAIIFKKINSVEFIHTMLVVNHLCILQDILNLKNAPILTLQYKR